MEDKIYYIDRYDEELGCLIRTFPGDMPENGMKWHWDEEDRTFEVVSGTSWSFQRDNELPIKMSPGMSIRVSKGEYHRGIKPAKCEDLVVKIIKL
jgi:hypothetical protein